MSFSHTHINYQMILNLICLLHGWLSVPLRRHELSNDIENDLLIPRKF